MSHGGPSVRTVLEITRVGWSTLDNHNLTNDHVVASVTYPRLLKTAKLVEQFHHLRGCQWISYHDGLAAGPRSEHRSYSGWPVTGHQSLAYEIFTAARRRVDWRILEKEKQFVHITRPEKPVTAHRYGAKGNSFRCIFCKNETTKK